MDLWLMLAAPLGLGLLGFVEPCSVGAHLIFVKYLEGADRPRTVLETGVFALTRALFFGGLGVLAAALGAAFLELQRGFWILLGSLYALLGIIYLARRHDALTRIFARIVPTGARPGRGGMGLGLVLGLNVPICAAPLLAALFAATLGAATVLQGFLAMALFGLALSLPLILAVVWERGRGWLDRLAALSPRFPVWTGAVFLVLGGWSIYFGVAA